MAIFWPFFGPPRTPPEGVPGGSRRAPGTALPSGAYPAPADSGAAGWGGEGPHQPAEPGRRGCAPAAPPDLRYARASRPRAGRDGGARYPAPTDTRTRLGPSASFAGESDAPGWRVDGASAATTRITCSLLMRPQGRGTTRRILSGMSYHPCSLRSDADRGATRCTCGTQVCRRQESWHCNAIIIGAQRCMRRELAMPYNSATSRATRGHMLPPRGGPGPEGVPGGPGGPPRDPPGPPGPPGGAKMCIFRGYLITPPVGTDNLGRL